MNQIKPEAFFPIIITEKLTESRDFYLKNFSFKVAFEADWYIHLVSENRIQLAFLKPDHPSQPEIFHTAYGGQGVIYSFETEDAEADFHKLKKGGVNIIFDLKSEKWGQKHFVVEDPNGMKIDIVQSTEPSEEYKSQYNN